MAASKKIGLPYNIAEFSALMQRILGTGILSHCTDDNEDSYDDYDEMKLEIAGDEITLSIHFYGYGERKTDAYDRLKKVRRVIGGKWEKEYGYRMEFSREYFGGIVELSTPREAACRRVVTSVEEIPERVIPERIEPAHTKENVEWVCDD